MKLYKTDDLKTAGIIIHEKTKKEPVKNNHKRQTIVLSQHDWRIALKVS